MKKKMLLGMIFTVFMVLLIGSSASAAEEMTDGTWTYAEYGTDGIEIVGYSGTQTDVYIPSQIDGKQVVRVGNGAFKDMTGLNSVTFSANIKELGDNAFEGATGLVCVLLNEGLETIGNDVFDGCTNFNSIILYDSIVSIGDTIFTGCSEATVYYIEGTAGENYALDAFADNNILAAKKIGAETAPTEVIVNGIRFHIQNGEAIAKGNELPSRTSINIPATVNGYPVTRIMENCFAYETEQNIGYLSIPSTVRKIGQYAFKYCNFYNIGTDMRLSEGILEIEEYAFAYTQGRNFYIPDSVVTIKDHAFWQSYYINIIISETSQLKTIGNYAFSGGSWKNNNHSFANSNGLYLPPSLESIGDYAFSNTWLKSLTITNPNTKLGNYLFSGNWYFAKLYTPNGLVTNAPEVWQGAYHGGPEAVYITDIADWMENHFYPKANGTSSSYSGIKLYCLNEEGEYTADFVIPEGVKDINGAFNNVINVSKIRIPSTVEVLGVGDLTSYYINTLEFSPKTLKTIEAGAFAESITVYYMDNLEDYFDNQTGYAQKPLRYASAVYVKNTVGEYEQTKILSVPESYVTISSNIFSGVSEYYQASWFDTLYIPATVTSVASNAFQYCTSLKNVYIDINETALTFDSNAFKGCESIENAYIDSFEKWCKNVSISNIVANPLYGAENLYVKGNLYRVAEIPADYTTIPKYLFAGNWIHEVQFLGNAVTGISGYAFQGSVNLTTITIPDEVTYIGDYAFDGCTSLSDITLPQGLQYIAAGVFRDCSSLKSITIPSKVSYVAEYAFQRSGLESVTNNAYLEYVSSYSFAGTKIQTITLNNVKTIGEYAFENCKNLTSATLPSRLTQIQKSAFKDCISLNQITIPTNVTKIQDGAFWGCTSLKKVTINSTKLTYIGDRAFLGCTVLGNVSIPQTVTEIGQSAFENCLGITNFVMPDSVTRLENNVFSGCANLAEITLSNNVKELDYSVLARTAITKIKIPESVTYIDTNAFGGCSNLEEVYFPKNLAVGNYYSTAFNNTPAFTAYLYRNSGAHSFITKYKPECKIVFLADLVDDVITYTLDDQTKTATALSCLKSAVGEVSIKDRIEVTSTDDTVEYYPVTKLNDNIFRDCKTITKVNLPDSIIEIGAYAFADCSGLTELHIPESVTIIGDYAFSGNFPVVSITIPGSVKGTGNYLFAGNNNIDSVVFGEGVEKIGAYIFKDCYALSTVTMGDSVHTIGEYAFYNLANFDITLSEKLISIGEGAFKDCTNVAISLKLIGDTEKIGDYAFFNCRNISSVNITSGNTIIGNSAFEGCTHLTEVVLSDNTVSLGNNAFKNTGVKSIAIPFGVKAIPDSAFMNCTSLKTVILPSTLELIYANAFKHSAIESITIPDAVTRIEESAFENCTSLTYATLPNNIKAIPDFLFKNCNSLLNIIIPNSVTFIGESVFANCTNLKTVTLSNAVTALPDSTFLACTNLSKLIGIENYTEYGNSCFLGCVNVQPLEVLHSKLEVIGEKAFNGAFKESSTGITLPESIRTVGSQAFSYCTSIVKVRIPAALKAESTTIATDAFLHSPEAILWVYKDSFGHSYALEADRLYFIIKSTANPEIDYGCAISGYVRYNDGSPAANVDVQLIYDDGTVSQTEKTDSNGQYVFSFAEVGAYKLRASDSADNIDTTSVSIKRKNVFSVILTGQTNLTLRKGWSVSGTATATGGVSETNPITVTMTDDKGDVIGTKTITTADGEFVFTNINNGEYRLVAENNNGLAHTEVIVHNKNHSGTALVIDDLIPEDGPAPEGFASIIGRVLVEDRFDEADPDKTPDRHRRDWVKLTLYDADGNILKHTKSAINSIENEYDYIFRNLPMGEYTIVAEVTLMRPHHHKNHENDPRFQGRKCDYHQPFDLKGYAYVEVKDAKQYIADDIILAEENDNLSSIKGKVTAQGSPQPSTVILEDVFHHEIATFKTKNNGKFEFSNIKDGLYLLTAVTDYDGVGFAVVYLRNGKLHTKFFDEDSKLNGKDEIHIKVGKNEKIHDYEMWFKNDGKFHGCTKDNVHEFKNDIEEMKSFYDGLSDRDKKGFAPEYLSRFWEMIEWLNCSDKKIDTDSSGFSDKEKDKVAVDNIGSIIPSDDIGEGKSYTVTVKVDRLTEEELQNFDISVTEQEDDDIEITTDEQYYQSTLEESAKNQGKQLGKKKKDKDGNETEEIEYFYYNIELSFSKDNGTTIEVSDIAKDTDTNGKLRLTLPIPEDFLDDDYTSYSLLHIHNGEITTLTDLDDDPMTITVEVDKFSVFAFARSNVEQIASYTVTWKNEDGTILETDTDVTYGTTPEYNSATPEKAKTDNSYYVFTGWTPEIADVTEDAVYTAVFEQRTDSGETVTITFKAGDKQFTKSVVSGSAFRLPVLTEDELNAAFVPERNGEPISAYTFFWKVTPGDASLAAFTEQDGYYLPDAEYTASADMKFEAAWIYTDAELVLLPNADKAIAANHEFAFDIYLSSADIESVTELESGEFTVGITTIGNKKYDYELIPNNGITFNRDNGNTILFKRKDGDTPYLVPENINGSYRILLGTVKVTGAGQGNVALTSPKAYRHIVEGADKDNNAFEVYVREVSADYTVDIPTADLEITIDFKNAVCDNTHEYQNMTLTVSGGDLTKDIIVRLGNDSPVPDVDEPYKNGENVTANAMADNKYVVKLESVLSLNKTYNVSVKGEGYRTARYSINMTKDKCLYFWNNVMDIPAAIEKDNPDSERATSFLAGDIVKDNEINIYDLSAVVSYFGEEGITVTKHPEYIKYDLNRDGKINSLDVAYVLVSWGK